MWKRKHFLCYPLTDSATSVEDKHYFRERERERYGDIHYCKNIPEIPWT